MSQFTTFSYSVDILIFYYEIGIKDELKESPLLSYKRLD